MQLLARREHSAAELQRKLRQRGVEADVAASAVSALADSGLQSDERYAEMLVRSRVGQGFGPLRIEAELRQAGIAADVAAAALAAADADWTGLAAAAQQRHFDALPRDGAERARQYRYLAGRGFDAGQIARALKGGDID
ncbi:MAG TPA: regulatory protein RecX [Candidatus Binatia bacterium]|nr:regulatory protein RecX [Candidatus Binatia bacterium]